MINSVRSRERQIIAFYRDQLHLSRAGAAALAGNNMVETGGTFDPGSYNPNEGAIGIVQWEGSRRVALQQYAAAHGGKETDLRIQLGFLAAELSHGYPSLLRRLQHAKAPGRAAAAVDKIYERSAGTTRTERVNDAKAIAGQLRTGKLTPSAPPAGSSGGGQGWNIPDPLPGPNPGNLLPLTPGGGNLDFTGAAIKVGFALAGAVLILLGANSAAKGSPGKVTTSA